MSSVRTLSVGTQGSAGTITLKCNEIGHNVLSTNPVPISGGCTVISGTGAYTALHGQGEIVGTVDLSGSTNAVFSEVLELSTT